MVSNLILSLRSCPRFRERAAWLLIPMSLAALTGALHLNSPPDYPGEDYTFLHRTGAAISNLLGPWGAVVVRSVGYPNAGLREFNLSCALALTLGLGMVAALRMRARRRMTRVLCLVSYIAIMLLWFGVGFHWIAAGRL